MQAVGRNISLSVSRRLMCDLMHFSQKIPLVSIERGMHLGEVVSARRAAASRPSWFGIFLKAFSHVASEQADFRRCYLPFPWPHLYEHPRTIASLAIERTLGDEAVVLPAQVGSAETKSLAEVDAVIRRYKDLPLKELASFRRALRVSRLPFLLRRAAWWLGLNASGSWRARFFGTFGVTGVANLGSASLHLLSPLTTNLTFGVLAPDGSINVRLFWDHRVYDGVVAARAMTRLEEVLNGPILDELRRSGPSAGVKTSYSYVTALAPNVP